MVEDYLHQTRNNHASEQLSLAHIESVLREGGKKCSDFGLPVPTHPHISTEEFNLDEEQRIFDANMAILTDEQRAVVDEIMKAVQDDCQGNNSPKHRAFFVDGPGGSGKTTVYNTLISWFRCRRMSVASSAWTGIAATLLSGGRTCHKFVQTTCANIGYQCVRCVTNFRSCSIPS